MNEQNYIRYRKLKALGNRACFMLCRIFPIKKIELVYVLLKEKEALDVIPNILLRNYINEMKIMSLFGL